MGTKSVVQSNVERVAASASILGEGPVWLPRQNRLAFVDIIGKRLLCHDPERGLSALALAQRVGGIVATRGGGFLAASERGLFGLDPETGAFTSIGRDQIIGADTLMNDAKCDRQGRLVFGSKALTETGAAGSLMTFDGETVRHWRSGAVLNGPAFSPQGNRIYFTDSPTQEILCASYDIATGEMGEPEVFATLAPDHGYPDGMSVDSEGCLWSAHWDGWRLSRYAPDGSLLEQIEMPVAKPTSLAFGGPELKTIYITSAKTGRAEDPVTDAPLAGDLFSLEVGVAGIAETPFVGMQDA